MVFEFKMPDIGEGIEEAEIVEWLVKEGDEVEEHQNILKVETEKAIVELPSPKSGKILKIEKKVGERVRVGETLAKIGKEESIVGKLEESEEILPSYEPLASPYVKKLAEDLKVDLSKIKGSGPGNLITEEDVRKEAERMEKKAKVVKKYDIYGYVERIDFKGIRKSIAEKMLNAVRKQALVTIMDEANVTELSRIREKEKILNPKLKLTFLPFIVKACIPALKEFPYLNSELDEENQQIILKKYYNIGIAVQTSYGLIVFVIKYADQKNILEIAKEINELAEKARKREIDLADLKGSTFTITNFGSIGGRFATPIPNYPESAILGIGRIYENEKGKFMPLSLTFDHRIIDGGLAAEFLNKVKQRLEEPELFLFD